MQNQMVKPSQAKPSSNKEMLHTANKEKKRGKEKCGLPPLPAISALTLSVGSPCSNLILGRNKFALSLSLSPSPSQCVSLSLSLSPSALYCDSNTFHGIGQGETINADCRIVPHCAARRRKKTCFRFWPIYSLPQRDAKTAAIIASLQAPQCRSCYMPVK